MRRLAAYHFRIERANVRDDRVLLEYLVRVRNGGENGIAAQLVNNSVRILIHVTIGYVQADLFVELACYLRHAIDCDHMVTVWQDYAQCWRYCEYSQLQASLVYDSFPINW